jgi:dTDP-4-amino-4,6-dideoxygalactose transaminase
LSNFEKEIPLMEVSDQNIVLFHPHVPESAASAVEEVLKTRWIGQGPKVQLFEKLFSDKFCDNNTALAVGSGTDALHLAYASFYKIDFLLTWNCNHLANANKRKHIRVINARLNLPTPEIVTPLELFSEKPDE